MVFRPVTMTYMKRNHFRNFEFFVLNLVIHKCYESKKCRNFGGVWNQVMEMYQDECMVYGLKDYTFGGKYDPNRQKNCVLFTNRLASKCEFTEEEPPAALGAKAILENTKQKIVGMKRFGL